MLGLTVLSTNGTPTLDPPLRFCQGSATWRQVWRILRPASHSLLQAIGVRKLLGVELASWGKLHLQSSPRSHFPQIGVCECVSSVSFPGKPCFTLRPRPGVAVAVATKGHYGLLGHMMVIARRRSGSWRIIEEGSETLGNQFAKRPQGMHLAAVVPPQWSVPGVQCCPARGKPGAVWLLTDVVVLFQHCAAANTALRSLG